MRREGLRRSVRLSPGARPSDARSRDLRVRETVPGRVCAQTILDGERAAYAERAPEDVQRRTEAMLSILDEVVSGPPFARRPLTDADLHHTVRPPVVAEAHSVVDSLAVSALVGGDRQHQERGLGASIG